MGPVRDTSTRFHTLNAKKILVDVGPSIGPLQCVAVIAVAAAMSSLL